MTVEAKIQAFLQRQLHPQKITNAVIGIQSRDKRVDLIQAVGMADPRSNQPMTTNTPYYVASISKLYTTAAIYQLVDRGLLELDAPLTKILPDTLIDGIHIYRGTDYSRQIRVYQLLSHTSGLGDYFEDRPKGGKSVFDDLQQGTDRPLTLEHDIIPITRRLTPKFEPDAKGGTKAHYSDTNYQLLGAIIEAVTEKKLVDAFREMIYQPLGLQHTYVSGESRPAHEIRPAMMFVKDRPLEIPGFMASSAPDGGVVTTASESLIFLRAFFDGVLFDRQHFARMTRRWNRVLSPVIQYGCGIMRFQLPRIFSPFRPAPEWIGHSGASGALAFYNPEKQLFFVGTINQLADRAKSFQLMMQIASMIK